VDFYERLLHHRSGVVDQKVGLLKLDLRDGRASGSQSSLAVEVIPELIVVGVGLISGVGLLAGEQGPVFDLDS